MNDYYRELTEEEIEEILGGIASLDCALAETNDPYVYDVLEHYAIREAVNTEVGKRNAARKYLRSKDVPDIMITPDEKKEWKGYMKYKGE